jgi:hypothetical protein
MQYATDHDAHTAIAAPASTGVDSQSRPHAANIPEKGTCVNEHRVRLSWRRAQRPLRSPPARRAGAEGAADSGMPSGIGWSSQGGHGRGAARARTLSCAGERCSQRVTSAAAAVNGPGLGGLSSSAFVVGRDEVHAVELVVDHGIDGLCAVQRHQPGPRG